MGGGYYDREVNDDNGYSVNDDRTIIETQARCSQDLNPKRWCNHNYLLCTNKNPIVFALDVTGSMSEWARIVYKKMPMFYGQIKINKYLEDPVISFSAIGDALIPENPAVQASDFFQGLELDKILSKLYIVGSGGGNQKESYDLAAYFYNERVKFKRAVYPFFFITGDEGFYDNIPSSYFQNVFGINVTANQNGREIFKKLMERFNVFLLKKPYDNRSMDEVIKRQWFETLWSERVLQFDDPKACIDIVLGAIAITTGSRSLENYIDDMKSRGQSSERMTLVYNTLRPYWEIFRAGNINIVKEVKDNRDLFDDESNNLKVEISHERLSELKDLTSKIIRSTCDDDRLLIYKSLIKLKHNFGDSIPRDFLCPITNELFFDPVTLSDGHTYERVAILCYLADNKTSPISGEPVSDDMLPNTVIKSLVLDFLKKNNPVV